MTVAMLILSRLGVVYSFLWFMGAFASQINIEKHSGIMGIGEWYWNGNLCFYLLLV